LPAGGVVVAQSGHRILERRRLHELPDKTYQKVTMSRAQAVNR
jgi:hypothetical protein